MNFRALSCLLPVLLWTACGHDHPHNPDGSHPKPAGTATGGDGHDHANMVDLGTVALGDWQVQVKRGQKIEPGKEAEVDLQFAGDKALPGILRAWIGSEDAKGSRKAKADPEGARGMHVHAMVPMPLAEESQLWLEVDGGPRAGVAMKL